MSGPDRSSKPVWRGSYMKIEHCENGGWVVDRKRDESFSMGTTTAFSNAVDLLDWLHLVFQDNPKKD